MKILVIVAENYPTANFSQLIREAGHTPEVVPYGTSLDSIVQIGSKFEMPLIIFRHGGSNYKNHGILLRELNKLGYTVATTMTSNYPNINDSANIELGLVKPGYSDSMFNNISCTILKTFENDLLTQSGGTAANTSLQVRNSGSNPWSVYIDSNQVSPFYVPLAVHEGYENRYVFGYLPKQTDTGTYVTEAPVFHMGFMFESMEYKSADILKDVINFAILNNLPPYIIKGYVRDNNNQPLQRTLRIYRQSNGALISTVQSDENGFYSYRLITIDPVFIVCFSGIETINGQIYTNIIPSEVIDGTEVQNIIV